MNDPTSGCQGQTSIDSAISDGAASLSVSGSMTAPNDAHFGGLGDGSLDYTFTGTSSATAHFVVGPSTPPGSAPASLFQPASATTSAYATSSADVTVVLAPGTYVYSASQQLNTNPLVDPTSGYLVQGQFAATALVSGAGTSVYSAPATLAISSTGVTPSPLSPQDYSARKQAILSAFATSVPALPAYAVPLLSVLFVCFGAAALRRRVGGWCPDRR